MRKLKGEIIFEGLGLHTGEFCKIRLKPRERGYVFVKNGKEIPARYEFVSDTNRNVTLERDGERVMTVEHLLSSLYGLRVLGAEIEVEGPEVPALDGSSKIFVERILENSEEAEGRVYNLKYPIEYEGKRAKILALPSSTFKVSYAIRFEDKGFSQFFEFSIGDYIDKIAPARTFVFKEDIEWILKGGLGKGGNLENVLVIGESQDWRFPDEPVRHKVLDFIGDLSLSGIFINAHFIVLMGSHADHVNFAKLLAERGIWGDEMEIGEIFSSLPHRFPFLLVDKIVHISEDRAVGIKNVTINEWFFEGHFPENPVMPGVLQIESMAQVAGAVLIKRLEGKRLVPLFVGIEDVKFKRIIKPGDTMFIYVKLLRFGGRFAKALGEIFVDKELVASAVMTATFIEK